MGRQRAGPGLEILLSPDGAAALMSVLIARPLAPGCPMSIALVHATERLAVEAREAMTAAGRPLELASTLCNLAAEALSVLTVDEAMDARLTHGLTASRGSGPRRAPSELRSCNSSGEKLCAGPDSGCAGAIQPAELRRQGRARQQSVSGRSHEPGVSSLAPPRAKALGDAEHCGVQAQNGHTPRRPRHRFGCPSAINQRPLHFTVFSHVSQDILTVTGTRFCRLPSLVCSALHLRTV